MLHGNDLTKHLKFLHFKNLSGAHCDLERSFTLSGIDFLKKFRSLYYYFFHWVLWGVGWRG